MVYNEDTVEISAEVSFARTLLAECAEDLPYIQGLLEAKDSLETQNELAAAEDYIDSWVSEIETLYIGKAQDTCVPIVITVPASIFNSRSTAVNIDECQIVVSGLDGDVDVSALKPKSIEAQKEAGKSALEEAAAAGTNETISRASSATNSDIQDYDRIDARDYARDWSCSKGLLTDHSSCHNPEYSFYDNYDCANFVSQCLYAGGLSTDRTWYADSSTWVGVAKLCNYLVDNDLFFKSYDESDAFAGSVIRWTSGSHVGLVDQNDTIIMTFCAHTKCRNSCPWTGENVYFYVPYWDSYAGEWT